MKLLAMLWQDDAGQDIVEYALIAGLISVVAYLAITGAGGTINNLWTNINSSLTAS